MTNRDNYQKVGIEVDQQSFAQLQQKTNDATNSINQLSKANQAVADSAAQAGTRLQQAFQAARNNIDNDVASLKSLRTELGAAVEEADQLNEASKSTGSFGVEGLRRTGGALTQLGLGDVGQPVQRLGDLGQVVKELGTASEATGVALGPVTVALGGIALAVGVFKTTLDNASQPLSDAVTKTEAYYKAIETGTTESLKNELNALEIHQKIAQQQQKDLQAAYDAAHPKPVSDGSEGADLGVISGWFSDLSKGGKDLNSALEQTNADIAKTKIQIDALKEAMKSDAVAANDAAAAHNELHKTIGEFADTGAKAAAEELKQLNASVRDAQKARDEMAQKEVDSVNKYNDAIQSANDAADQARLNAAQKLNDALVNAAKAAVDAADKALQSLEQKRADNLTSLDRDLTKMDREAADKQLTDQIAAQKQERDDLQAHLEALKQIRDRDKGRERDDLLNRNYRDLFALKEQQSQDIGTENDKYTKQEAARQEAFKQQQQDETRAQAIQRRERLIAYQQANEDAVKQYNRDLAAAAAAKEKALEVAKQGYQKELAAISKNTSDRLELLRKGEIAELKLITQTEEAKRQLFQQTLDQARQMLGQATASQGGPFNTPQNIARDTGFAGGGDVPAYQRVKVNDGGAGQRESFNGLLLPRGLGLFIPMTSGRIDAGNGDRPININMPINGVTDPVMVGKIAREQVRAGIQEAFGK